MDNNFLHILKTIDSKASKEFAKVLLGKKERIVHEIKDFTILDLNQGFYLVNKQSFEIKHFDTQSEALNKALDFYKSSTNIQNKLKL